MLKSSVCKQEELLSKGFQEKCMDLHIDEWFFNFSKTSAVVIPKGILHRKAWEWAYIAIALEERGLLSVGKRGVGFAVGSEPLPAFFASKGCSILATDLGEDSNIAKGWMESGQNVDGKLSELNKFGICEDDEFDKRVEYRNVDMNEIPMDLREYDFCWSSCAIEHVGSLEKSKMF